MKGKLLFGLIFSCLTSPSLGQESPEAKETISKPDAASQIAESESVPEDPVSVNVSEVVFDDKIEERLCSILKSTEWFQNESEISQPGHLHAR